MSSDPAPQHATQLRNHWYWRPGWNPNRRFYTWHITFEGQDELHRLVATYQDALRDVPGLDLIPLQWLHLTMQGVGFTDEVRPERAQAIADAAGVRLAKLPSVELTFQRPVIRPEAIALPPTPAQALATIRDAVRDGMATVWGEHTLPETDHRFEPHLSLAYVKEDAPADTALRALRSIDPNPAQAVICDISLIVLYRDDHLYRWKTFANALFREENIQ